MELDTTKGKYEGYKEAAAYVGEQNGKTVTTLDCVYTNSFSASVQGHRVRQRHDGSGR